MYTYNAILINVVDGDTMDFSIDLGFKIKYTIRVRLANIDTPEIYHPRNSAEREHGKEAALFVEEYFLHKTGVLLTSKDKKGKYGRYLAEFKIPQSPLNSEHMKYLVLSDALYDNGFSKQELYGGESK